MSKVLVTGTTGFIGNHVTRLCLEQGDDVRVMVMPGEDRSPLAGMEVEFVEGNLLDPDSLAKAVRGVNRLYHLAALFAVWTKDPDLHYKINVNGTRHVVDACRELAVPRLIFTSSPSRTIRRPYGVGSRATKPSTPTAAPAASVIVNAYDNAGLT